MPPGRQPERTCIGCRAKGPKPEFVRIVRRPDGEVVVDGTGREPGRGAYLHPRESCLVKAKKSGAVARALRTPLGPARAGSLMVELRKRTGEEQA